MISKNQIKHIGSLKLAKFRKASGEFVAEGDKMVRELISSKYKLKALYALPEWLRANQQLISEKGIISEEISPKELERISSFKTPNQVLAIGMIPEQPDQKISFNELVLVLDKIQDPGNLGTIIRTAEWFGIKTIVCSDDTADLYNPKVIQATMGSFLRIDIHYTKLTEFFQKELPENLNIYGALLDGENLYKQKLSQKGIIIIGNESHGISDDLAKFVTHRISIPAHPNSKAESLNASVAASVICAEFRRQRMKD